MARLAIPLSDLKCRTAKPRDRAYKLFDGGRHVPLSRTQWLEDLAAAVFQTQRQGRHSDHRQVPHRFIGRREGQAR
jgi:hypothetical protein